MKIQIYILFFIFASCGARKVERTETAIESKIETTQETQTFTISTSIAEILDLVPIDTLQPAVLEIEQVTPTIKRYTIKNAVLRHENKKDSVQHKQTEKVAKIEDISVLVKDKQVERKANTGGWWLLLVLLIIIYFVVKKLKS
jgi:hypothetical protein